MVKKNISNSKMDNEPLHIEELAPGSVCMLLIAAYTSSHAPKELLPPEGCEEEYEARLIEKITKMLEARSVEVTDIEKPQNTDKPFAILIYANYCISEVPDLEALRQDLQECGSELGLSLRMQRSELFYYMHRI